MDWFLITLSALFLLLGVVGCILPVLPGPPLSYVGLLLLHFTQAYSFTNKFLIIWGIVVVLVTALDYAIPALGTKKFGGSKWGVIGSVVGLIIGLFLGPIGIIVGPFVGAVAGELLSGKTRDKTLKAGIGSFIGFLVSTGLKLMTSIIMAFYFVKQFFM